MSKPGPMLSSWKEIASYLGRTVRTCQRLESFGLPVHRLDSSPKAHVFAYTHELDDWLAEKLDEGKPVSRSKRVPIALAGGLAVVAVAAGILAVVRRPAPDVRSVAVVAHDLNPHRGLEHVPDGIADAVRNALMRVDGLTVAGRFSSEAARNKSLGAKEIGRALGVANVLDLGVTTDGEEIRVTAALISAKDGFHRWANEYEERLQTRGLYDIRDRITGSIVDQLKVVLLPAEEAALSRHPTEDNVAYNFYMKGRDLLGRPWLGAPTEALRFFDQALGRDPKFALAKVGSAWVTMNMISQSLVRPAEAGPMAEAAVREALAMEPDLAEAHALDGWIRFLYEYDWAGAEKSFMRALELKPGDGMIRGMFAYFLLSQRRFGEARTGIKRALALDPLMPVLSEYSIWIHLNSGRISEALKEAERVLEAGQEFEFAYSGAGLACFERGRVDESLAMFEKAQKLNHAPGRPEAGLVAGYLEKGDRAKAEEIYDKLVKEREKTFVSGVMLAWSAEALGDTGKALDWLDMAYEERDPMLPLIQGFSETFMPDLIDQPRYRALLDKLRLPR